MKVLTLISGGDKGGAKTHVLSLLREISKNVEVLMICFMESEFTEDAKAMGINTLVLNGGNIMKVIAEIRNIVKEGNFDIIHSHGSRGNFMAWLLKKHVKIPLLTTVHSDYKLDYMGRPLAGLIYGTLNRLALRRMDYFIGVSDSMTELLISRGIQPDSIYTIYNGIDFDIESKPLSREAFLDSYGIKAEADWVFAGIAARIEPVKDIATLIKGFSIASSKAPKLRLLIAGKGPEEDLLKELASQLGVSDKIYFLGWVTDTDSFYASLDINTITSVSETFPYALTEGIRQKLATISSRVGGVPKLIDHGVNGFMFEPGRPEELAEYLARLCNDSVLRAAMAEKLLEKTKRNFSLAATCRTQLNIYDSVYRRYKSSKEPRNAISVCGAYGLGNSGDEAILRAILGEIREIDPDITIYVISKNPKITKMLHKVRAIHSINLIAFARIARKSRLYINGGGSLIQDVTSRRSIWFYLYTIRAAKKRGARVMMYGCGIGPVNYKGDRELAAKIISKYVDVITLREDSSLTELKSLGVKGPEILLAADPAIALPSDEADRIDSYLIQAGLNPQGKYACFSLRPWRGFENIVQAIAETANALYEREGIIPVFLSIDCNKDAVAAAEVIKLLRVPNYLLNGPFEPETVIGIMSKMTVVISMRLHALIFSAGHGIPLVGIVYDPKVSSFLSYIGQEHYLEMDKTDSDSLTALVLKAMNEHSPQVQRCAVERLRSMERVNRKALARMLEKH